MKKKAKGQKICGARAKSTGKPCRKPPEPNGRCRLHGGKSVPPGPGHHRFKHGRYSKAKIDPQLMRRLEQAANDPQLMSVSRDVEALEARLMELLEQMGQSPGRDFSDNVQRLLRAQRKGDQQRIEELIPLLERDAQQAQRCYAAWTEYERVADTKRRLIESHHKSQVHAGQVMLLSHVAKIADEFLDAVVRAEDLAVLKIEFRRIYAQMAGVYGGGPGLPEPVE